jgi:acetylornithine/succinyldiaminopimelate/putrescine aminotransferase
VLSDERLHAHASAAGSKFLDAVRRLELPQVREVRGRGLMLAVELKKPATPVIKAMQEGGVLALPGGGTVIRFLPSILIDEGQLDEGISAFESAVRAAG